MRWMRFLALASVLAGGTVLALVLTERLGWPRPWVIPLELAAMVLLCEVIDGRFRSGREILSRWTAARDAADHPESGEIRSGLRAAAGLGGGWDSGMDAAVRNLCAAAARSRDVRLAGELERLLTLDRPTVQSAAAEALVRIGGHGSAARLRAAALEPVDPALAMQFRDAADRLDERLEREGVPAPSYTQV